MLWEPESTHNQQSRPNSLRPQTGPPGQIIIISGGYVMIREVLFALFALILTVAVVVWLGDGPRLDVQMIEVSASK
jgi:hypothetical protein